MLSLLHIENIAVIEQADISFSEGLNVLTGETGAGKSIIIDAISAILGQRTPREIIRTGCSKASVSAVFLHFPEHPWFADHGIDFVPDELLIRREIHKDGKNVCHINGQPATVAMLRELGLLLVDIHGQNETQTLFREETHLDVLDLMLQAPDTLKNYKYAYDEYAAAEAELRRLSMDDGERIRKTENLRYELQEIEAAQLRAGEETALNARCTILRNAERLSEGLQQITQLLGGTESEDGALDRLSEAEQILSRLSAFDDSYGEWKSRLSNIRLEALDVTEGARDALEDLAYSGNELERVEQRLHTIERLCRKYGGSSEAVLSYAEQAADALAELENTESRLQDAEAKRDERRNIAFAAANELRIERKAAAETLKDRLEQELRQLDMPSFRFAAEFISTELTRHGTENVRFLMSSNAGESLRPLSKIASGGELARIMLAVKNVLSEKEQIPTLIFDEVDAGVSGRAAQKVAEKLLRVSVGKQVLCVTHLPQIAAIADHHYRIQKDVSDGRTYTSVLTLDRQGRIEELSRIIGGSDITENTRKSAADMLRKI